MPIPMHCNFFWQTNTHYNPSWTRLVWSQDLYVLQSILQLINYLDQSMISQSRLWRTAYSFLPISKLATPQHQTSDWWVLVIMIKNRPKWFYLHLMPKTRKVRALLMVWASAGIVHSIGTLVKQCYREKMRHSYWDKSATLLFTRLVHTFLSCM